MHRAAHLLAAATTAGCEARRIWERGRIFRAAETRRIEVDRNGPTGSEARRAEESERESEMADVGEEKARGANARQEGDWRCSGGLVMLLRVVVCALSSLNVQGSVGASIRRQHRFRGRRDPARRGSWSMARKSNKRNQRQPCAREKREEERNNGREKLLVMTCGRSIVRPASVSRSETWDGGESGVRKFGVFVPCWPFSETPARRGVHRRGRGDFQRAAGH